MKGDIEFWIGVPSGSWMNNRNGTPEIIRLGVVSVVGGSAWIRGMGVSGKTLRGGISIRFPEALDQFCQEWLRRRGKLLDDRV